MRFTGKMVWITGASSGIGAALAHAFSREGANLILSARSREKLEEVRQCAPGNAEDIHILPLDLTDADSIQAAVDEVKTLFGRVDILVNNAGVSQRGRAQDTPLETVRTIMETNFFGTVALTQAILPSMLAHHSGHLVVVSSVMGKFGAATRSTYAASKHALHGYFDSLRCEHYRDNLKVSLICPGYIHTNISRSAFGKDGQPHGELDPGQAQGMSPDDCAKHMLNAIAAEKEEAFIGGREILGVHAKRLIPGLFSKIIRRINVD
ncbi:MAG: SDR family oxidoreductase [Planctomycetota bacterium]|jgi:short-subunit dehydrogenase